MNGMILILCLIWGFNFVVMKSANGAFPPVLFAAFRFFVGAAVLFGVAYFKKIPLPSKRNLKWYILCGILQTTYFNLAIQISLNYISAGLVSVLTYSMPLFFCILAHFFIPGERLTLRKIIGIIIGIIGLFFALNITHLDGSLWTLILALSSAISWAVSNLIIKQKLQNCDKIQFTAWQMAIGAGALFLYSFCFENGQSHWSIVSIGYILFSGIIASALAFVLWSYILTKIQASKASISLLMVPVVGIISSYLFLKESLKVSTLIGVLFVLLGIWIVNSSSTYKNSNVDVVET
jgi:Permeases of the drug/metabolite transporter (DMT) superfamily